MQELIEEDGAIRGVRYRSHDGLARSARAADGRRRRALLARAPHGGLEPVKTSPPMDVLWFRLPRRADDAGGHRRALRRAAMSWSCWTALDQWQVGYVILKGSFQQVRAAGLEALRRSIAELAPEFADRAEHLQDWEQVAVLSVESSRCRAGTGRACS